jgi:hypothetical protein
VSGLRPEADGDGAERSELKNNFFAGRDPQRGSNGAGHDNLSGLQRFAESAEQVGGVPDDVDQLTGQRLQRLRIGRMGNLGAVSNDVAGEALEKAAGARRVVRTENDVALIDVAGKRAFNIIGGMIDVGEFRWRELARQSRR